MSKFLKLLALLAIGSAAAHGADAPHAFRLDNGLQILVQVDRRAPIVVSQLWYRVGSSYEHDGITGVSHALEHMMFKGTQNLAPGEFSRLIARNGGRENAFTGRHYTAYFQRIHRDKLELCLRLEAERMRGLRFDPAQWAKEKTVIQEERLNRTDDRPAAVAYERFNAAAFVTSPSRNPVIGWRSDIDALTTEDLRDWYDTWYRPNNAILVVAGDVDAEQVRELAQRYFGALQAAPLPALKPRRELPQQGVRRLALRLPATVPYLIMGYKVPALLHADDSRDAYALKLITGLLDGGQSARFARLVRDASIAVSAGASYELYERLPTLFTLSGTPGAGASLQELEQALRTEVLRLQQVPVDGTELARVKTRVTANEVYGRDSVFYQAMQLGIAETNGVGYARYQRYLQGLQAVTAADIQRVARRYLVEQRLTVTTLEPDDA